MIQETVSGVEEYPISFDLEPISNLCASTLRKMPKKTSQHTNVYFKNMHPKKKPNLKIAFGWLLQL